MPQLPLRTGSPTMDEYGEWQCHAISGDADSESTMPICGVGATAEESLQNCELAVNRINAHEELCASLEDCVVYIGTLIDQLHELGESPGVEAEFAEERGQEALDHFSGRPMPGAGLLRAAVFLHRAARHVVTVSEVYKDSSIEERLYQYEKAAKNCLGATMLAMEADND